MKDDPEEFWDNIPREIPTPPPANRADPPRVRTIEERVAEETKAERFND